VVVLTAVVLICVVGGGVVGLGGAAGAGVVLSCCCGGGGDGGAGIIADPGAIITNLSTGSIAGGNGGVGGPGANGGVAGANGAGGVAIRGSDISIVNSGSISGGLGGDGVTRAYALHLTGGANSLLLASGSSVTGGIQIDTGGSLAFDVSGNFGIADVISGGGSISKTGAGILTLSGTNTYTGGTELGAGTVQLDNLAGLGSGDVIFRAGSLRTTVDGSFGNQLRWFESSTGALSAATGTTLTLTGSLNVFGPNTIVQFGTATDTGTIIAAISGGSSNSSDMDRLIIGGGTFRTGGLGTTNLLIGIFEAVQIDGNATLDLNGGQPTTTLNYLEGNGALLNDGAISIIGAGDFAGTISGSQNILKVGAGTLRLTGTSNYSGTTTVADGTLQLGNVGAIGFNSLTLSNGSLVVETSGALGNTLVTSAGTSNVLAAATSTTSTLGGTYGFAANSALRIGNAANAGTVRFGFSGGSADPSFQLFVDAGTLMASNDSLSSITQAIARTEIAAGATLDFNGQVDINGRGGRILNLQGAGRLLNDGENTYLLAGDFAGQIEGSQSISKLGAGTLVLTGTNSYSGATTINGGTLQLGEGATFGTLGSGNVNNNGTLTFWGGDSQTLTVANTIGGSGALVLLGGTVILTGNNSFSGGLIVADGTLGLGSDYAAGGAGNMITTTGSVIDYAEGVDNATPITIASDTTQLQVLVGAATQSGAIGEDQPGRGFEKIGAGTLVLTGTSSYSGVTLVTEGLINYSIDDHLGTSTITLDGGGLQWASGSSLDVSARLNPIGENGGTFDTNGNDVVLASTLSGPGSVTKTGVGILTLSGVNSYAGGTFVSDGTLALGEDGSAGTGAIALANGTRLLTASCGCDPLTIGNDIAIATGSATIDTDGYETWLTGTISGGNAIFADTFGGGLLVLTGSNTYGDTTIESAAEVQVGDGGTSGSLGTGNVLNDGVLVFDRSDDVTFSQVISGAGMLVQAGYGTLTLTGTNTYTGGTTIDAGTLRVGDGGTVGTLGSGDIVNYGALLFDRSDDLTVGDDISGSGSLVKYNQGTLTLTGFNTYTGTTSIFGGTLAVSDGALSGTGLIEIDSGGTLAADGYTGLFANIAILEGGGTIDTGSKVFDVFGGVNFGAMLTKTGSGVLLLEDFADTSGGYGGINVTAGTLALGSNYAAGFGTIRLADGTWLSNASCYCGSLSLDNDIEIAAGGTATINGQGGYIALNGVLSGGSINFIADDGQSSEGGSSIFLLSGLNTYDRTTIGPNVAVVLLDGTLGTGDTIFDPTPSDPFTPSALVFANSADYNYGGAIIGAGLVSVETFDPETKITLSGSNTSGSNFTGTVEVSSGHLNIEGDFGDIDNNSALLTVEGCFCGDATLGGSGTFHGDVEIDTATLAPGSSPGTLAIAGNLTMGAGTILNYELGQPGVVGASVNDLVTVGGTLTLDGTLNVIDFGPSYGPGYYRLFNYNALVDNALTIGTIDGGLATELLFNVSGQVNLRLGPQVDLYWDGTDTTGASTATGGNGGGGTWNAAGTNWTAASGFGINDQWRSVVGVFAGSAAGTVTVEGTQTFEELRFETDGYVLQPFDASARLATTGAASTVDVGAGLTADIGVVIQGGAGLTKTGAGALLLSAANTYSGATTISAGTLRLGVNNALTDPTALDVAAGATFDLAGFTTHVGSLSGAGAVTLGGGRLDTGYNNSSTTFSGTVSGDGVFTKNGGGTLTLAGTVDLTITGGVDHLVQINAGTLDIAGTGSLTAEFLQNFSTITNAGTITADQNFQNFGTLTNTGTIAAATQNFGTLDNNGGTMGALQVLGGTATNSGTIDGNVQTFASFTSTGIINGSISNFATALVEGQVNGGITNSQTGATVTLTGITTGITNYQGAAGSTLDLANFSTTVGDLTGTGSILIGTGTLTVSGLAATATFNGDISGSGALVKTGTGEQVLGGVNTYSGLTTVSGGTLAVGVGGSLAGSVQNDATFVNDGTVAGTFTNVGTATNSGLLSGVVINSGTLTTTGTIGGNVTNHSTMFASGESNGQFTNLDTVTLTGAFTGITDFYQAGWASLDLAGFDLTAGSLSGGGSISLGGGTLTTGGGNTSTSFAGPISGPGGLTKVGTGTLTLASDNSYSGTTTISGGTLQVGAGGAEGSLGSSNVVNDAALVIDRTGLVTLSGVVTGSGSITKLGAGTLEFAGDNTPGNDFTGSIQVSAGSLLLNGILGDTAGNTAQLTMDAGTSLGGSGSFLGSATVNGTLAAGNSPGTLTIAGNLTLGAGTILNYELGEAGTPGGANNDLVVVGGDLTLDGTLNTIAFGPGYRPGYYRLFDYGGSLTDNGLTIGTIDGALSANVLTNISGQVNVVLGPQVVQYWDDGDMTGASAAVDGNGGNGTWNASNTNWTAEAGFGINDQWRSQIGVFAGAAGGVVSIEGTQAFQELRFTTDGYVLESAAAGDGLTTTGGFSVIDVTVDLEAFIGAPISGAGGLTKTGFGTLTLGGANSYAGATTVSTGILSVAATGSLAGSVVNSAAFDNAGTVAGLVTNNAVLISTGTLNGGLVNSGFANVSGQLNGAVANSGALNLTGTTTGIGAFTQTVTGTFGLNGVDVAIGSLSGAGQVQLGSGTLTAGGDNSSTSFTGVISGSGGLTKTGTGALTLSGVNTYTGTTTVSAGTLLNSGTLAGPVVNQALFTSTGVVDGSLTNSGTANLAGRLNGAIDNSGVLNLTGVNTGIGAVTQTAAGLFALNGFDTTFGSLSGLGSLDLGSATLTTNGDGSSTNMGGSISGTGGLIKIGDGELTLSNVNTFTGLTTVSAGTLTLAASAGLYGDVQNDATFRTSGFIIGNLVNNDTVEASGSLNGSIVNNGSISLTSNLYSVQDFTQAATGSLTLNGYGLGIGTLAGAGTIDLGNSILTSYGATDSQFDGTIVGPGQFQKGGTGTLTLGGDSSVDLYVFEGTLILTGSVTGYVNVVSATFQNDGTVDGGLGTNTTGIVQNTGAIAGHITNYGVFTSSGTVGDGLVNYGGAIATNSGTITGSVFNSTGGTFVSTGIINGDLENYFGTVSLEGQLNGSITNVSDIVLTGTTVGIGLVNQRLGNGLFDLNGFDTTFGSLVGDGEVRLGTALLTVGGDNSNFEFDGVITGAGGVTKTGTGILWLTGAHTYTGLTTISDGWLALASGGEIAGDVQNEARFESEGLVAGMLINSGRARSEGRVDGGVDNSGTLETLGVVNGNLANTGTVYAEGTLNGAIANDSYFLLTGSLSGVTDFLQNADGYTDLDGYDLTTDTLAGAGVIELGGGIWTAGGTNGSFEWGGEMSGTGGLTKVGTGTMRLTGTNTYTGTTTVSAGTLINLGSLAGPVDNSATFVSTGAVTGSFTNSGSASLAGQLNGPIANSGVLGLTGITTGIGALSQTATGTFALNGFNTVTGSLAGDGQVQLGSATLTTGGDNTSTAFAGVISGSGGLTKAGTGTLTLSAIHTYTGTTTVTAGTLSSSGTLAGQVVNLATFASTGTVAGSLTNSGTANLAGQLNGPIANSGVVGLTGVTAGIGAVTQTAAGTFALNGFATTIGSLAGAGQVQLGSASLTTNGDNSTTAFAGIVSGTGALTKVGTGTLVLGGANTFTGITTIAGGMLQLGDGGTAGSLASSSIVDNGVLAINRSDLLQISAAISGSGGLIQGGTGTTQLTGANTYTGGTLVSAGRLVGNTASLQGAIQDNATLEFAQAGAGTYSGSLSGTGAMEKTGIGRLTLTGDNSSFTGVTRVLGGQLAVNGLLSRSVVTVGPGATLMGLGPVGGIVAQAGSIVAPGNSIGTLQVNGNVQFQTGSTFQVEVSSGAADLINATGTAQLAGTLALTNLGGTYTLNSSYVILNAAGGRTGTFDLTTGTNAFGPKFRPRVVYTANQVQLLMAANRLADLAGGTLTPNQASFLGGFDAAVLDGGYDPQPLEALYNLSPEAIRRAVDQLSGGVYPAVASAALEEERLVREAAVDRLRLTQDGEATGTGAWAQLVGSWGHVNADGTGFDVDSNREGAIVGIDTGGAGWRVGFYGHHIETELDADALGSEAHLDRTGLGAYAGFASGAFRARLGASYSDLEFSTTRTIAFPGFSAATSGQGDGSMVQGFGEMAYRFDLGQDTFLEPFADIALAKVDLDAINETGSAAAQLRVAEQEHDVGRAIAGLRGDAAIQSGSTRLRLGIDAGLQHNFGDRSIAALIALDSAPQSSFTVRATELQPWAFVGGGRVAIDFGSNVTATVAYRGVLAGNRNDHAASGTLSVRF
jgi:fibronectin-binding autotransporter adhesin